ncbi:MAG: Rid family hydrolase, partial [Gemmatimonadales bacterium]
VRVGSRILVSGTTASHADRLIGGRDPEAQTHAAIDKLEGTLVSFGASLRNVVRTRVYVADPEQWLPVSRALGERFRGIDPANTLVGASLVGDDFLVEIEAEAIHEGSNAR